MEWIELQPSAWRIGRWRGRRDRTVAAGPGHDIYRAPKRNPRL